MQQHEGKAAARLEVMRAHIAGEDEFARDGGCHAQTLKPPPPTRGGRNCERAARAISGGGIAREQPPTRPASRARHQIPPPARLALSGFAAATSPRWGRWVRDMTYTDELILRRRSRPFRVGAIP